MTVLLLFSKSTGVRYQKGLERLEVSIIFDPSDGKAKTGWLTWMEKILF